MATQDGIKQSIVKVIDTISGVSQSATSAIQKKISAQKTSPGSSGIHSSVYSLPAVQAGKSWAKLETIDGKDSYEFLINPEQLSYSFNAELSALSIAGSNQELQRWKSSRTDFRIPDFQMFSPNNDRNLAPVIQKLIDWTRGQNGSLPLLKFSWGDYRMDRCYLSNLEYSVLRSRGGHPTYIKGSLVITPAPQTPKIRTEFVTGDMLTDRERTDLLGRIQDALKRNKEWMKKYGIYAESKIDISPDGDLIVDTNGKKENLGNFKPITDFLFGSPTQKQ